MNTDERRLIAPNHADESATIRVLDATSPETNLHDSASTGTTTTSTSPQPPVLERPKWLLLEVPVFMLFFALYLTGAVNQNQLLYQTCVSVYHYNETTCEPLLSVERESPETKLIEEEVQGYVARILMARTLIESIIPAIIGLFIGPWSDKFGRRPILLNTFFGYPTGLAIFSLISYISTRVIISPWWFLLASVPSIISGGTCALITGIYCYISDVVHGRQMSIRMIYNEATLCAGMMIGNLSSSYIYEATNVYTTFAIASSVSFLAWMYIYFLVGESIKPELIQSGPLLRSFFRFDLVKDLIHTCFKRRPNYDRAIIWLTQAALTLVIFTMEGEGNVNYLFMRNRFSWTLKDYSFFGAARIIIQIIGSIFGTLVLRKLMNVSIISMTLIAFGSCVLESVVRATASQWYELYIGMFLGMMRGVFGPMSRAILSHVVPPNEVGKIMALTTSMESISPLFAGPLYTAVYTATIESYPGAFNFISSGVDLICYTLISGIFYIQKSFDNTATYQMIGS